MKTKKLFFTLLTCSLFIVSFSSCEDDNGNGDQGTGISGTEGVYILNSGNVRDSDANLIFYSYHNQEVTYNVFADQNDKGLGDTAQDMIVYGSKVYVAVFGSDLIYVLNKQGKEIGVIRSSTNQQPRNMTAYNGNVYVTYFDGYLAKIDTTSYQIESQVKVGRYPEYVREANNKLYVANSGGLDYASELGYDKTVSVIDPVSMTVINTLEVVINPDKMAVDSDGSVFVVSNGDYSTVPNTLQKIDSQTDEVTILDINATYIATNGNNLYYIYSQWIPTGNEVTIGVYNTKSDKVITTQFIADGTLIENPYSLSVDRSTGYVYIGTSDYVSDGDMYVFNSQGKLLKMFDTKGLNPMGAYFVSW